MTEATEVLAAAIAEKTESASRAPIRQNPQKLGGEPTIGEYRVHAVTLIDYLIHGKTVENFLADFDGTSPETTLDVLRVVRQAIDKGILTGIEVEQF